MENETQNSQYAGRRGAPSEAEVQAMGRNRKAPTAFNNSNQTLGFSTAHLDYPTMPLKRRHSKRLVVALCSAAGLILILFITAVIVSLFGQRSSPNGGGMDAAPSTPNVVNSSESSAATPLADGEFLYTGHLVLDQVEDMQLSFVLSADRSYLHDVKLEITNLTASVQNGNVTTEVNVSSLTESYSGEYPVDFEGGGTELKIGKSTIRNIYFSENLAYVELDYIYYSTGFGSDADIEIPLGRAAGELVTEVAPKPADSETEQAVSSEDVSLPSTQTVFDYTKLKNWKYELTGGVYNFEPVNPTARYYIVCTDTVIDPVTGIESTGGYENNFTRHQPVSIDDVLRRSGELSDGGLVLTDDPNLATYALTVSFAYDHTGTFTFDDGTAVTQYHGTTQAELYNFVTGESIYTDDLNNFATYANENVYTQMLDNAKGKQLYAQSYSLSADDFSGYWDFIKD